METQELDVALDELENRLDRLRSLYEQYFLGIEKIEPTVARKDVDRRFWILRRVKIRNTARRFRMQVLIQRYNTFQQYWARICREIENGTYVRHLLRVQKKAGDEAMTWAAKKRLGLLRKGRAAEGADGAESESSAGDFDMGELLAGGADLAAEAEHATAAAVSNADRRESAQLAAPAPARAITAAAPRGPFTLEDLGPLDLDFDDEPPPAPKHSPVSAPKPAAVASPKPSPLSPPKPAAVIAAPNPSPVAAAKPAAVAAPNPSPGAVAAAKPAAPQGPANGTPREAPVVPAARSPSPAQARPAQGPPPAQTRAAAPNPGPAAPRTAQIAAQAPMAPGATRVAQTPARPAPNGEASLSDERVRALHAELVAAKRNLKQGDAVSVDSLAKTLRETEKKLRAQHQGRNVDFQIVVKDGKPIVKPIVRK